MTIAALILSIVAILISLGLAIFAKRSAIAAERSAVAAENSADEAMKSRTDTLGPLVSITDEQALRKRWLYDPMFHQSNPLFGPPPETKPEHALIWPSNKGIQILLGAHITLRNEGSLTATVSIGALRSDRCDNYDDHEAVTSPPKEPPSVDTPDTILPGGKLLLAPGEKKGVIIRNGPSLEEWRNVGGDQPIVIVISAETSPDGTRQSWEMKLASTLLQHDQDINESLYKVASFELPEIGLTMLPREYPSSRRRSKND